MKSERARSLALVADSAVLLLLGVLIGCASGPASEAAAESGAAAESREAPGAARSAQPSAANRPAPRPVTYTIPAGTTIAVRTTTQISTRTANTGDRFDATLAEPLVVDGQTIARQGARVVGVVSQSDPGGRVKGRASLSVSILELETSAGPVPLATGAVSREARSTAKQDAAKVGIGAGVGAAVGAIAGGGKGAAIGSAVGGGAAAGHTLATHGEPAVIPAETVLRFNLTAPATVTR
jgi:hypothetical protein